MKIINHTDIQMNLIESSFKNLSDNTNLRKEIQNMYSKLYESQNTSSEANSNANLMNAKYGESLQQIQRLQENCQKLQKSLNESFDTQNKKDSAIINLKKSNLEVLQSYKKLST